MAKFRSFMWGFALAVMLLSLLRGIWLAAMQSPLSWMLVGIGGCCIAIVLAWWELWEMGRRG